MTLFRSILLFFYLNTSAFAYQNFSFDLGLDSRFFPNTETPVVNEGNVTFNTNISYKFKSDIFKMMIEAYAQADPVDTDRSFIIPKDIWIALDNGSHILKAGFQIINWSATEAFHPVDVINSRFLDSNLQRPSKIGEPIISYKYLFGESSSIEFMYMPYFTDPILATEGSAFGPGWEFDEIQVYDDGTNFEDNNFIHQGAFQFNTHYEGTDISLSYINHVDRDIPAFVLTGIKNVKNTNVPIFDAIYFHRQQFGLTTQSVLEDLLIKTEMAYVDWEQSNFLNSLFTREDYFAFAAGLETTNGVGGGSELTLLLEYQTFSGIDDILATNVFFQNDFLLGVRYAFNDLNSKEIFFSVIGDIEYTEQFFFNLRYSQRLYETWTLETGLHFVEAQEVNNYVGLDFIDTSDHVYLNLRKYF